MKIFMLKKIFSPFLVLIALLSSCGISPPKKDFAEIIRVHALNNDRFTFSEILDFEWDVAYVDNISYGKGQHITEKYNLDIELEMLDTEHRKRLLFFNNGAFLQEVFYEYNVLCFPDFLEIIYPDTILYSLPWEETSVLLSTNTQIELNHNINIQDKTYQEISSYLLEDTEAKKYIYNLVPNPSPNSSEHISMHLSKINIAAVYGEQTILIANFTDFTYYLKSPNKSYNQNFDIGATKIHINMQNSSLIKIENFNGDSGLAPFKAEKKIADVSKALNLSLGTLSSMMESALKTSGVSLELLYSADISFEIGNDGIDYIECQINIMQDNSEAIFLKWQYNDNLWNQVI